MAPARWVLVSPACSDYVARQGCQIAWDPTIVAMRVLTVPGKKVVDSIPLGREI